MFVKICGLTTKEQIDWAIDLGYSAIGIVLYPKSPRYCNNELAVDLTQYAKDKITTVVVSKLYSEVEPVATHFDYVQIHEYKNIKNLIYASTQLPKNNKYSYFIFDGSMGSGTFNKIPDWVKNYSEHIIISGGLTEHNIQEIIKEYKPFGVDVSSGVELTRGVKDFNKMKAFIEEVNNADT